MMETTYNPTICPFRHLRRERANHGPQPTALVREAYFRLVEQKTASWQNRTQFYAVAPEVMRRVFVDHARKKWAPRGQAPMGLSR
jgi:hypothetical protein